MNRYAALLLTAMLLVGGNVGIGKTVINFIPVPIFATLRFVVAAIVLGPLIRPSKIRQIVFSDWLNLFLQALFGTFLFTILMLNGLRHTSAVAAGVMTSAIPAVVAIFAWILLGERLGIRAIVSVLLAVSGIVVVNLSRSGDASGSGRETLVGNLFVFGAVCCEALYVIYSRRTSRNLRPIDVCIYTHAIGLLLMLPIGGVAFASFDFGDVPAKIWVLSVWYGLAASVFAFWLWMRGIQHVAGNVAGVFTAMVPVAASFYGIVFNKEPFRVADAVALVLVIVSILVASGSVSGASHEK
ncbi:DMT family transporter [Paraburkholderia sp. MM5482-R1]|uniref:DMT family transporter n=1 Tax=unclassified Paraburkholderia TaxID=2615204 RepID=UPI003D1BF0DF